MSNHMVMDFELFTTQWDTSNFSFAYLARSCMISDIMKWRIQINGDRFQSYNTFSSISELVIFFFYNYKTQKILIYDDDLFTV